MLSVHVNTRAPAFSRTYQEGGCTVAENKILHPFSTVVHTHRLGEMVTLWRGRRDAQGGDHWTQVTRRSPALPQSFVPVRKQDMMLLQGDRLALRCSLLNMSGREVRQGLASYDEMCDVYIMYWVPGNHTNLLQGNTVCSNPGPPTSSLSSLGFNNIPVS